LKHEGVVELLKTLPLTKEWKGANPDGRKKRKGRTGNLATGTRGQRQQKKKTGTEGERRGSPGSKLIIKREKRKQPPQQPLRNRRKKKREHGGPRGGGKGQKETHVTHCWKGPCPERYTGHVALT